MQLSIIILNYNVRYFLELCLKSVQAAITTIDAEIIVVDNNSTDSSCVMVKNLFPDVCLIENKDNFGFSKGNNIGVLKAKGDFLCILNPDTVVAEDTFIKLLKFATETQNPGIIGCKLINGSGMFLPESKRNIPYPKISLQKILGNPKHYYANHLDPNNIGETSILVGAFMLLKRSVYIKVGGFDEDYFMYGEDIDLSYRVLKAGYTNYYYGKTTAIHFKGESTLKDKQYIRRFYGAMQIFYKKHLKSNILYDTFVWFGIKFFYALRSLPKANKKQINQYIFVSNKINENLKIALKKPIISQHKLDIKVNDIEIIFDANYMKYKDIIDAIGINFAQNKRITFKILPNNSDFVIGSNNGLVRGEIIKFN